MDLNLTTTAVVNNDQENNQLLLNAIKNKFAAKTATEAAAFSPPKFNIPVLKIPGTKGATEIGHKDECNHNSDANSSTQLNTFLLKQLQEQHTANGLDKTLTGFLLPNLESDHQLTSNEQTTVKFELPALRTTNTPISSLTTALNKLQVHEHFKATTITTKPRIHSTTPAIDLTSALTTKPQYNQFTPPTRDFKKPSENLQNSNDLDFEIPFIDCDRIDVSRKCSILLPLSNEYCVTDISQLRLKHNLTEPSAIGRLLNSHDNKYTQPLPLKCFSANFQQQSVKHIIEPFRFDTNSPDDLVTEALNKYQRRYHN